MKRQKMELKKLKGWKPDPNVCQECLINRILPAPTAASFSPKAGSLPVIRFFILQIFDAQFDLMNLRIFNSQKTPILLKISA
jgi:hypothetical protein